MLTVAVKLDTTQLEAWAAQATNLLGRNLRSAVDKSARAARTSAMKVLVGDARVPRSSLLKSAGAVVASRAGGPDYVATWSPKKGSNSVRDMGGSVAYVRGVPVQVSTFALTGGGSASLALPHGFVIAANGGRIVVTRTGRGRSAFKAIYAESAATALSQPDNAVRQAWQKTAEAKVVELVPLAVQAAFAGIAAASVSIGSDDDEA